MTGMVECVQTDTMTGMVECVQTDRHDDGYGGRVPLKKHNNKRTTKMALIFFKSCLWLAASEVP